MVNMTTITKMQEMKLSTMAAAFQKQLEDPAFQTLSFEERVGLMIDQEWTTRKNNQELVSPFPVLVSKISNMYLNVN